MPARSNRLTSYIYKKLSMETLLKINTGELNHSFVDFIRSTFGNRRIVVHVYEDAEEIDTSGDWTDKIKEEQDWFVQNGQLPAHENVPGFTVEELEQGLVK
jgi:hypothetical protein